MKTTKTFEPPINHQNQAMNSSNNDPRMKPWLLIPIVGYSNVRTWMVMCLGRLSVVISSDMLERESEWNLERNLKYISL